jgi:hypothetical protein
MGYCLMGAASMIGASATDPYAWAKFNPDEMNPVARTVLIPCSIGYEL